MEKLSLKSLILPPNYFLSSSTFKKRFFPFLNFILKWKKITEWYRNNLVHTERDLKLSMVRKITKTFVSCTKGYHDGRTLLYPSSVDAQDIIDDYVFKMFVEVVLSPHINIEWKTEMAKYTCEKASKLLSNFIQDIIESPIHKNYKKTKMELHSENIYHNTDEKEEDVEEDENNVAAIRKEIIAKLSNGGVNNCISIQPCAAKFWDFCRVGFLPLSTPREIRYMLLFDEPISDPLLSSGAGQIGSFIAKEHNLENEPMYKSVCALFGLEGTVSLSDIVNVTEHTVLFLNASPLTVAYAEEGFGVKRTWMNGNFVSNIFRTIVNSCKRSRVVSEKPSMSSDLLSDGSSHIVQTVCFGWKEIFERMPRISAMNKVLLFKEPFLKVHTKQLLDRPEVSRGW